MTYKLFCIENSPPLTYYTTPALWDENTTHLGFIKCDGLGLYITDSTNFLEYKYTLYNTRYVN